MISKLDVAGICFCKNAFISNVCQHLQNFQSTSLTCNFFSPAEIVEIKQSWTDSILDDPVSHGVNIFLQFFKLYPEIRGQMFGFLANMTEEELQASPRLRAHASGVILGITHIITGLENPVSGMKKN